MTYPFDELDEDYGLLSAIHDIQRAYQMIQDTGHHKFQAAVAQLIVDAGYPALSQDEVIEATEPNARRLFFVWRDGVVPLPLALGFDTLLNIERKLGQHLTLGE